MFKNKEKQKNWSKRYKERTEGLKPPAKFIKNNLDCLKKGTVLDLACGDGRNSIFLAKSDFEVTGIDFSKEALDRLESFSEIENVNVKTRVVDVDNKEEMLNLGRFDNIIISSFKPTIQIFKILPKLLNKDGILLLTTFNYRQSKISEFPRKYCLEENEFKGVSNELKLLKLDVFKEGEKHLDGYIFKVRK